MHVALTIYQGFMKVYGSFLLIYFLHSCTNSTTTADNDFNVSVITPELAALKPIVVFDEAHKNHHRIKTTYKPFAELIRNEGCIVMPACTMIDSSLLSAADIFIISTPMGKEDPGDMSPYTKSEVKALARWVRKGGSLLLITEHYPFGLSMKPVLEEFGIEVHNGYTEDTLLIAKDVKDALLFEKSKGNLNSLHPICQNIERVYTFTGSSVKGDSTFTPILIFSEDARNYNVKVDVVKRGDDVITNVEYADSYPATGYSQGLCSQIEKGKLVVLAESALLTAQIDRNGNKFGMNIPDSDNKLFALNLIRWLAQH